MIGFSSEAWTCRRMNKYKAKGCLRSDTSESLDPSKLLSLMLADPIKVVQSSTIMILLCTYTYRNNRNIMWKMIYHWVPSSIVFPMSIIKIKKKNMKKMHTNRFCNWLGNIENKCTYVIMCISKTQYLTRGHRTSIKKSTISSETIERNVIMCFMTNNIIKIL